MNANMTKADRDAKITDCWGCDNKHTAGLARCTCHGRRNRKGRNRRARRQIRQELRALAA